MAHLTSKSNARQLLVSGQIHGLHVRMDRAIDRLKPCCDNTAIICTGRAPHAAELRCTTCDAHRGWLSKTTFEFLSETVRLFGVPTGPFCIHDAFTQTEQDTQMKVSEMFPSPWLTAGDLNNHEVTVEFEDITYEAVGKDQEKKPIAKFKGKSKRLILNKTNCRAIAALYGDDSRAWPKNQITLFPTMTQVGDESKPCVRTKAPKGYVKPEPSDEEVNLNKDDMDDEIPF